MQDQLENYLLTFYQSEESDQLTDQLNALGISKKSDQSSNVKRHKNSKICDYLIRCDPLQKKLKDCYTIQEIISSISKEFDTSIASCTLNSYNSIEIKLNRPKVIQEQLHQIFSDDTFKTNLFQQEPGKQLLINCSAWQWTESLSLNHLRGILVTSHLQRILKAKGFNTIMVNSLRECAENTDRSEFIKEFHLEDMCTSELVNSARKYEEILSKLKTKCLESKYCIYDNGNYFINASHFIKDSGLLEDGIFKNVELIKVMSCDQVEPILLAVTSLELAVQEESNSDIITTVNVVPHNKLFYATKMSLLWQILSNKSNAAAIKHQVNVAIERVITVGDINLTLASDLIRLRKAQMKRASILKYGSTVHDPSWQGIIAEVASTTIKFEMLGTSGNEPLKINVSSQQTTGSLDKKGGSFVLYNCARLSTLFQHFNEQVTKSTYPPLPPIEKVDFTLLRHEEEWELFFNCIYNCGLFNNDASFLMNDQTSDLDWRCNKICQFMTMLCRTFSSYYRSIRILTEPKPHLFPVMHARLYLMKAIHLVLINNLALLNIKPLSQL